MEIAAQLATTWLCSHLSQHFFSALIKLTPLSHQGEGVPKPIVVSTQAGTTISSTLGLPDRLAGPTYERSNLAGFL